MLNKTHTFHIKKLSTRIVAANVVLFLLITGVMVSMMVLFTKRFADLQNRDTLIAKTEKIQLFIEELLPHISYYNEDERVMAIYQELLSYYIVDNTRDYILVLDNIGNSSFNTSPQTYSNLFSTNEQRDLMTYDLHSDIIHNTFGNVERIDFDITHQRSDSEKLFIKNFKLPYLRNPKEVSPFSLFGQGWYYSMIHIPTSSTHAIYAVVFLSTKTDQEFIGNFATSSLIATLVGLLVLLVVSNASSKRVLRPLSAVSNSAKNITSRRLDYRIPEPDSDDEIRVLVCSLNEMLSRLDHSFKHQKQFASDASHELRIPLTIMMGYLDLLKKFGTEDRVFLAESLSVIEDETQNMKKLIDKLLFTARVGDGKVSVSSTDIDIQKYIEKITYESTLLYPMYQFTGSCPETYLFQSDEELLTQVMRGIIENAVKYSPKQSMITIGAEVFNKYIVFYVKDEGAGIASKDIPNLTKRFYRADSDRNRKSGGAGLGLSIADGVIAAMGGQLNFHSTLGVGTTVNILLPKEHHHTVQQDTNNRR